MTMPVVAFDFTPARLDVGGTGVYTRELGAALSHLLGDRFIPISCPATRPPAPRRTFRDRLHTLARDLWWYRGGSSRAARRAGAELVHAPMPSRRAENSPPMILTIFDVAVLRFPEKFRRWFGLYQRCTLPDRVRQAAAILTLSEASKAEIVSTIGIEPDRITVVPCGVAPRYRDPMDDSEIQSVRDKYGLATPFALTVGYIEPRKNLERLLRAVAVARSSADSAGLQLVHAGPQGWLSGELPQLIGSLGLRGAVRFIGHVPERDLAALYRAARLTAYPSLYEGFGLPVAEAMASGCPVLTSDRSSLVEVAGDAGLLVDPQSVEAIADGLRRLWCDDSLRADLGRRGRERAAGYTWPIAAKATIDVYRRALSY